MGNNQKTQKIRKTWFESQAERKGQNFLSGWANGQDKEFRFNSSKVRAITTILRDIKDGLLDPTKDLTEQRLLNPDLLNSIITVCNNRYNYFLRQYASLDVLLKMDELKSIQNEIFSKMSTMTVEEKKKYVNTIDPSYRFLAEMPSVDVFNELIPVLKTCENCSHDSLFIMNRWMANTYIYLFGKLVEIFMSIKTNSMYGKVDPTIINTLYRLMNEVENKKLQDGRKFPLDFNDLISQVYF